MSDIYCSFTCIRARICTWLGLFGLVGALRTLLRWLLINKYEKSGWNVPRNDIRGSRWRLSQSVGFPICPVWFFPQLHVPRVTFAPGSLPSDRHYCPSGFLVNYVSPAFWCRIQSHATNMNICANVQVSVNNRVKLTWQKNYRLFSRQKH